MKVQEAIEEKEKEFDLNTGFSGCYVEKIVPELEYE